MPTGVNLAAAALTAFRHCRRTAGPRIDGGDPLPAVGAIWLGHVATAVPVEVGSCPVVIGKLLVVFLILPVRHQPWH